MVIDQKAFEKLKKGFEYLEEYDKYGDYPDKRIVLSVTIPLRLKKKLDKKDNVSRFVEKAIDNELRKNN
ncbi:MAG: hypothetical protein HY831_01385 [Candidatus Aenigmarchaeota archaeon]|nr:hypothetical protein [Candidatus Aenigmarchaeota archaeon]